MSKKKEVIISITDHCNHPFEDTDIAHFNNIIEDMFSDYDVDVDKIEIREVKKEDDLYHSR